MMIGDLRDRRAEETDPALAVAEAEAYVAAARTKWDAARMTSAERLVLEAAGRALTTPAPCAHPFVRVAGAVETQAAEGAPSFVYSGYVTFGNDHFAIVNGRAYRAGDIVEGSSFVIRAIAADHVLLEHERSGREQRAPIQDKGSRGR